MTTKEQRAVASRAVGDECWAKLAHAAEFWTPEQLNALAQRIYSHVPHMGASHLLFASLPNEEAAFVLGAASTARTRRRSLRCDLWWPHELLQDRSHGRDARLGFKPHINVSAVVQNRSPDAEVRRSFALGAPL